MNYQRKKSKKRHTKKRHIRSFGKYRSASHQFLSDLKATGRQFKRSFKRSVHSTGRKLNKTRSKLSTRFRRNKNMPVHHSLTVYGV